MSDELEAALADADEAYATGRFDRAWSRYQHILGLQPGHAAALSRCGAILARQGDLDGAENYLTQALTADPHLAQAHSNLGNVLYTRGRYAEALERYRQAVALAPDSPLFQENLAAALKQLGQIDQAIAALKQAHRLSRRLGDPAGRGRTRLGCGGALLILALAAALLAF